MPPGTPREAPPARSPARLIGRSGIGINNHSACTPRRLGGPTLTSFLGPCNSNSERMQRFCIFH
eukprot:5981313-Alexandrium_andersonii.AAC.1